MDEQIIERLRAGDTEGVTLLQTQYGPMVRPPRPRTRCCAASARGSCKRR